MDQDPSPRVSLMLPLWLPCGHLIILSFPLDDHCASARGSQDSASYAVLQLCSPSEMSITPMAMLSALFRYSQPVLWYHEGPIDLGISSLWSHLSRYTLSQISQPNIGQSPSIHSLVSF